MNHRVIFSDNGVLVDWSTSLASYLVGQQSFTLNASEDYIYIGSRLPFNHLYFKLPTVNTNPTTISVEYWEGTEWKETFDVIDETQGFTKSGHITFTPNKRFQWGYESTNYEGDVIDGLEDVVIYDLYWMRLKFTQNTSAMAISWIGNIFCEDSDIYSEFPDLQKTEVLTSYKLGKTNWEEQRVRASEMLIHDLIYMQIISDKGQILNRRDFTLACVQKTVEIILMAFGDDYLERIGFIREEYKKRLAKRIARVDKNNNAIEDKWETKNETGFLRR